MAEENKIVQVKTIQFKDITIDLPRRIEIDLSKLNMDTMSKKYLIEQIVKAWYKDYIDLTRLKNIQEKKKSHEEIID